MSPGERKILLISGDEILRRSLSDAFAKAGITLTAAAQAQEGLKLLREESFPLILLDSRPIGLEPEKLVRKIISKNPLADLVALIPAGMPDLRVRLSDLGIDDFFDLVTPPEEIVFHSRELLSQRQLLEQVGFVGKSPEIKRIAETLPQVAASDLVVLITGESGTGKELLAQAIHKSSARKDKPFLAINCGAIAEGVLESELFGHEKGAFTGAIAQRPGMFEVAHGGTLLLDEIGEMKPATQVKLLRVLEEKSFLRVGGKAKITVDVRVIAATNRDLAAEVAAGNFRRDLYYRLSVIKLDLPPLRARRGDIPLLFFYFINHLSASGGRPLEVTDEALRLLADYHWPGNVRELKNFVERAGVLSPDGRITGRLVQEYIESQSALGGLNRLLPVATGKSSETAERELLYQALVGLGRQVNELRSLLLSVLGGGSSPPAVRTGPPQPEWPSGPYGGNLNPSQEINQPVTLDDVEREAIERALTEVHGNRKKAAQILGIGERTLYRKIDKYGLRKR
jgi:DNA-binding NtrC family response regulator